jgi:hypothetical protein
MHVLGNSDKNGRNSNIINIEWKRKKKVILLTVDSRLSLLKITRVAFEAKLISVPERFHCRPGILTRPLGRVCHRLRTRALTALRWARFSCSLYKIFWPGDLLTSSQDSTARNNVLVVFRQSRFFLGYLATSSGLQKLHSVGWEGKMNVSGVLGHGKSRQWSISGHYLALSCRNRNTMKVISFTENGWMTNFLIKPQDSPVGNGKGWWSFVYLTTLFQ